MVSAPHLRIIARVHLYPPEHCAGAEVMLATLLSALAARGHDVSVMLSWPTDVDVEYVWDGVRVIPNAGSDDFETNAAACDVLITHLECAPQVVEFATRHAIQCVQVCHNDFPDTTRREIAAGGDLLVANSIWLAASLNVGERGIVVPPPVLADRYRTSRGEHVTLVNMMADKGADTFWQVARVMRGVPFLAVEGAYGRQIFYSTCPNVAVQRHTPDMRAVYARTRVLMMPSSYESWGRVGVEAMCSGIPVVAHPTQGLRESLGDAGIFVHRDDVQGWVTQIERLLNDPEWYAYRSQLSRARADELDPTSDISRFCKAVEALPVGAVR